jgi:hypothetical protein
MKQFFTLALIAGALMVTSSGQARMVATRAQCVASCGGAVNTTCGWITKRGRFNRCRTHLITQCRKFGTDVMCPAPAPPPAPPPPAPVATTTTTTTLPYVPPTTTTLPPPQYGPWTGTWTFYGTLFANTCPAGVSSPALTDTFYVVQTGTTFTAEAASIPGVVFSGSMNSDGGFTISANWTLNGGPCVFSTSLTASPSGSVIYVTDSAGIGMVTSCPSYSCAAGWTGSVSTN